MLPTGGNERTARAVAAAVGIEEVIDEVPLTGKADVVKRLQEQGRVVAMPRSPRPTSAWALAPAPAWRSCVAIVASDLTLVTGDLRAAADAIQLSRHTLATIKATGSGRSPTT